MSVTTGQLQGPILRPLLFNTLTNDLQEIIKSTLLKCIGDTKLCGNPLILLRVGSHSEGPEQAGRMIRQETSEIKQGKVPSVATGTEESLQWHRL